MYTSECYKIGKESTNRRLSVSILIVIISQIIKISSFLILMYNYVQGFYTQNITKKRT